MPAFPIAVAVPGRIEKNARGEERGHEDHEQEDEGGAPASDDAA